jgi:hypothetical protein
MMTIVKTAISRLKDRSVIASVQQCPNVLAVKAERRQTSGWTIRLDCPNDQEATNSMGICLEETFPFK